MDANFLLGFTCLCSPLTAMLLDFNTIRGSAEVFSSTKNTQCLTDKGCPAGKFCHKSRESQPSCASCHGPRRRCQRDAMCCPGLLCVNDVCSPIEKIILAEGKKRDGQAGSEFKDKLQPPVRVRNVQTKGKSKISSDKAQEGESCLRTSDCAPGLCCARHFWAKICKPVLTEGQVCSRRGQKDGAPGPEIFQRCNCGSGLSCKRSAGGMQQGSRLRVCHRN